jgi:hypothetical protein
LTVQHISPKQPLKRRNHAGSQTDRSLHGA